MIVVVHLKTFMTESHDFESLEILSVTFANYGTTVMGNYDKIRKLQIVFTVRLQHYLIDWRVPSCIDGKVRK